MEILPCSFQMRMKINDIACYLPQNRLTSADLSALNQGWDMEKIEDKTGVLTRRVSDAKETSLDMGVLACNKLFDQNPGLYEKIDSILFCTTTPDYLFPQNSYILHKELNFPHTVFCLDIGLACSGFVYSLAVAKGLIATGVAKNILIVTAESLTKFIHDQDRACKPLFSDGASATWVSASQSSRGIIDMDFGAMGKAYDAVYIPAGLCRMPVSEETKRQTIDESGNIRTPENLSLDGKRLMAQVGSHIPRQVRMLLNRNHLSMDDIDLFVFHQGSKLILDSLQRLLRIPPEKNFRNYQYIGNTSSSSIPMALREALDQEIIKSEDRVLISGFGSGFSWGTAILEI